MRVAWVATLLSPLMNLTFNHHFSPHSPFTNRMTELKLGNDPAGLASSHEFDFHCDDEDEARQQSIPTRRTTICQASAHVVPGLRSDRLRHCHLFHQPRRATQGRHDAVLEQRAVAASMHAAPWFGQAAARSDVCLRQLAVADLRLSTAAAIRLTLSLVDPNGVGGTKT